MGAPASRAERDTLWQKVSVQKHLAQTKVPAGDPAGIITWLTVAANIWASVIDAT
jgi:hypothetical protein